MPACKRCGKSYSIWTAKGSGVCNACLPQWQAESQAENARSQAENARDFRPELNHHFRCPGCQHALALPEKQEPPFDVRCPACETILIITSATDRAEVDIFPINSAFATTSIRNCFLLLTQRQLVVCASDKSISFDLHKVGGIKLELQSFLFIHHYGVRFSHDNVTVQVNVRTAPFRIAILDAIDRLNPYPGDPICWYCRKNDGRPDLETEFQLHKLLDRQVSDIFGGTKIEMKYIPRTVSVPRCEECAELHRKRGDPETKVFTGGLMLLFAGFSFVFSLMATIDGNRAEPTATDFSRNYPFAPLILAVGGLILGAAGYFRVRAGQTDAAVLKRKGVLLKEDVDMYPPYRSLWEDGFRAGSTPT